MKKTSLIKFATLALTVIVAMAININAQETDKFTLTVTATGLHNSKGRVQFALYNKDGTIPDQHYKKYYKKKTAPIKNGSATTVFKNLPKGRYAVNILHDENSNGKIDKRFIKPIEGIGFTNYTSIGLTNRPKFSKASFMLTSNTKKQIKIIYL